MVEEIKDINLEIGAANLFLQRAENQDELKVILAKGEMAHFHVTKQENQLEMSYKKNGKISREETDEIIVQIPENHHLENMSVSIGAGKLKAENITVMESWSWKSKTEKHACKKSGDRMRRWKMSL